MRWVTVKQVSRETGYSLYHLRRLARQGRVRAVKVTNQWLIDYGTWQSYLQAVEGLGARRGPKTP